MADESLAHIATAIVDGTPVDWGSASETLRSADDRELLDGLKLVADLTRARGVHLQPPPDLVENAQLREWGPLRVIERVGHGTFGDVYRAWDTRLDREVALKLLTAPAQPGPSPIIEEGRLLARVRHPNVVTIYGAEARPAVKPEKIFLSKSARKLPGAVGAKVEKDHTVSILNGSHRSAVLADYDDRQHKLISDSLRIILAYRGYGVPARAALSYSPPRRTSRMPTGRWRRSSRNGCSSSAD